MNNPDNERQKLLEKRKIQFMDIYHQRVEVLIGFLKTIGFQDPATVMYKAVSFTGPLSNWGKDQIISDDFKNKIHLRFAYFIGEFFLQKYSGQWYVNERTDSRNFAQIVVGKFEGIREGVCINPFDIAKEYVDAAPVRDLSQLLNEVCIELEKFYL